VSCVIALTALLALAAPAVQTPDFSGTWVEDPSVRETTYKQPAGGPKSMVAPPMDLVVIQTPATLTTERTFMSQVIRYVHHLDGKESVNYNGANTLTTKSRWEGKKLVSEGTSYSVTNQGESTWKWKEVRWLNAKGQMVVETTTIDEAGTKNVVKLTHNKK
jgi:hypothetical protein